MTKKMQSYSAEFKAEAVKKIADNNGNLSATARQLGIAMQTLSNWRNKANEGKLKESEQYDPQLATALEEIKQLKRQLKVAEEEREILNEGGDKAKHCLAPMQDESYARMRLPRTLPDTAHEVRFYKN